MELHVKDTMKWLRSESSKDNKKFASILALKELLI